MKFEYTYGVLGYFMRYFGGVFMLLLTLLFGALGFVTIYYDLPQFSIFEIALIFVVSFCMTIFSIKGTYYCFRYSSSFTKKYQFYDSGIKVLDKTSEEWHSLENIESIVYLKTLMIFEIRFNESNVESLILMNNGQNETGSFILLKDFLLSLPNIKQKWV